MLKTLTGLECKRVWDLNILRRGNRYQRCHSAMNLAAYGLVTLMLTGMLTAQTWALTELGVEELVPGILILAGTAVIFLLSLFGMGQQLYSSRGLDMLRAMPVKIGTLALARLLTRYMVSLALTLVLLMPGTVLYGVLTDRGPGYYGCMLTGIVGVPLIPMGLSAVLDTGIRRIAARTRHPGGVQTLLSVAVTVGILVLPMLGKPLPDLSGDRAAQQLLTLLPLGYAPANWIGDSALGSSLWGLPAFWGVSLGVSGLAVWVVCRSFDRLTKTVQSRPGTTAGSRTASPLRALYTRERRRYFASPVYVSNTVAGPILALAAAVAAIFLELPGPLPPVLAPVVWTMLCCTMPSCAVAMTMEGKQVWQLQSLPVPMRIWLGSKVLWSLTLMAPSYVLSQIALTRAFRPGLWELLWQLTAPLVLMLLSCTAALAADLRFHRFDFDQDMTAVKQSLSALVGGFCGPAACLVACGVLVLTDGSGTVRLLLLLSAAAASGILWTVSIRKPPEAL